MQLAVDVLCARRRQLCSGVHPSSRRIRVRRRQAAALRGRVVNGVCIDVDGSDVSALLDAVHAAGVLRSAPRELSSDSRIAVSLPGCVALVDGDVSDTSSAASNKARALQPSESLTTPAAWREHLRRDDAAAAGVAAVLCDAGVQLLLVGAS
jgi:hypothetical protein